MVESKFVPILQSLSAQLSSLEAFDNRLCEDSNQHEAFCKVDKK